MLSDRAVNFTSSKSLFDSIRESTGKEYAVSKCSGKFLEEGRSADILLGGKKIGFMGEVNKKVLGNFGVKVPVCLLEIEI
jgi:phenylalanyl-tRNA synthetase beta subunit